MQKINLLPKMRRLSASISRTTALLIIVVLQTVRPLLGPDTCRFSLTCTKYAVKQLREKPLLIALPLILKRLWACRPFAPISLDFLES